MASQTKRDDESGERVENERRRERHEGRLRDFARRILAERPPREPDVAADREGYVPLEVARDAMASILETGDRAKTEAVRMVAREVRHYLDELQLVEGLEHMLRNHRLEIHASLSLEPKVDSDDDKNAVRVEAAPKRKPTTEATPIADEAETQED